MTATVHGNFNSIFLWFIFYAFCNVFSMPFARQSNAKLSFDICHLFFISIFFRFHCVLIKSVGRSHKTVKMKAKVNCEYGALNFMAAKHSIEKWTKSEKIKSQKQNAKHLSIRSILNGDQNLIEWRKKKSERGKNSEQKPNAEQN